MKPSQLNLNLLKILDTLLKTRSSAAAARDLHISQPAVSKHLASLREHFHDPLLVRSGGSTLLTPRAEILSHETSDTLARVYSLFSNIENSDHSSSLTLRFAISNQTLDTHLGKIISCSTHIGQKVSFIFLPVDEQIPQKMNMGEVDLYLGLLPLATDIQITEVTLLTVPIECLMSENHPLARATGEPLTVEELQSYPMISVATGFSASEQCQQYFADTAIKPDHQFFFQELTPALTLVQQSEALLIDSLETARQLSPCQSIIARKLPGKTPQARGGLCWPAYWENSSAHRKIRENIIELAGSVKR